MEKIYKTEKEGQIDFFNNYGIPWQENNGVLVENSDGVYNGVLFEFKLNINGEREISDRQKVVRGSNVSVLTSHAGLNPRLKHASSLDGSQLLDLLHQTPDQNSFSFLFPAGMKAKLYIHYTSMSVHRFQRLRLNCRLHHPNCLATYAFAFASGLDTTALRIWFCQKHTSFGVPSSIIAR